MKNHGTPPYLLNPTHNPLAPAFPLPNYLNPFVADKVDLVPVPIFSSYVPNMKSFVVREMLEDAAAAGKLKGKHTVIEATSGNTGASLGIENPHYGIRRTIAVVERDTAPGKLEQLRLCGVEIMYPSENMTTIGTARELGKQKGWINLDQYANPANPRAHERYTGPHVWRETRGKISAVVIPAGTTGSIIGTSNFLRRTSPRTLIVAAALAPGEAVPGARTEEKLKEIAFDWRSSINDLVLVKRDPSYRASLDLIRSGRMFGPSSGLSFWAALQFIQKLKERNALDSLRFPDGRIAIAFTCGDLPFPYMDKYSTILEGAAFNPLDPSTL